MIFEIRTYDGVMYEFFLVMPLKFYLGVADRANFVNKDDATVTVITEAGAMRKFCMFLLGPNKGFSYLKVGDSII